MWQSKGRILPFNQLVAFKALILTPLISFSCLSFVSLFSNLSSLFFYSLPYTSTYPPRHCLPSFSVPHRLKLSTVPRSSTAHPAVRLPANVHRQADVHRLRGVVRRHAHTHHVA